MNDLQKAIDYVRAHGNDVELARLALLLQKQPPPASIIKEFQATQRQDGGWSPFWAPDYSSLDATCYKLAQLEQLGVKRKSGVIQQAMQLFIERQKDDGRWQEDDKVANVAPPWAKPGDLAATLYLTTSHHVSE